MRWLKFKIALRADNYARPAVLQACYLTALCLLLFFSICVAAGQTATAAQASPKNLSNMEAGQTASAGPVTAAGQPGPAGPVDAAGQDLSLINSALAVSTDAIPASTGFDYPVGDPSYHAGFDMNNCFGCDYLDLYGHTGNDFDDGREGDPAYSTSEGVVVWTGLGPGAWGNVIIISHNVHGTIIYSQYAHLREIQVVPGQTVGRRQQVGIVGTTGTTAPHLHFEIKDQPIIGHGYTGYGFSSLTVSDSGINYWDPTWWIDAHRYFWDDLPDTLPPAGLRYYWSWYDDIGGKDWLLMANPRGSGVLNFDVNIRRKSPDLSQFGGGATLAPGQIATPMFPGLVGGPAVATSLSGDRALVSQRIIWGGSSIEEVPGAVEDSLSDNYFWPWYDMLSPGFMNWVLVANPSQTETVTVTVSFRNLGDGQMLGGSYDLAPGESVTPVFPGKMGGPVEVRAVVTGGDWNNTASRRKVIASQRVLSSDSTAFNEVPGIAAGSLTSDYLWTWYDGFSPGARNWVLAANPSQSETVTVQLSFTDLINGQPAGGTWDIPPGQSVTPEFSGSIGGPVELKAWVRGGDWANVSQRRPVMASQRVLWGPSFEEVPGSSGSGLSTLYRWTWYDQLSPGMTNWVLVSNPGSSPIYYEIAFPGVNGAATPGASGVVQPGQSVTPSFPGEMGGPVTVRAWAGSGKSAAAPFMASQRVLYNGYFNELTGTVLN